MNSNQNDLDEKLNELKDEFESTTTKKESKYRTKKRLKEENERELIESMSGVGSFALSLLIERMPKPVPLTDLEKQQFDIVTNKLISKYFVYLDRFQEETAFLFVTLMIILPRTKLLDKNDTKSKKDNTDIRSNGFGQDNISKETE